MRHGVHLLAATALAAMAAALPSGVASGQPAEPGPTSRPAPELAPDTPFPFVPARSRVPELPRPAGQGSRAFRGPVGGPTSDRFVRSATPATRPADGPGAPPTTRPAAAAGDAKPADGRLFELRIYTAAPGKMAALNARFRDHTLRLFAKHGVQSVGYWAGPPDAEGRERLYYVVAYPNAAARERMLVNGIAKDPEFRKVVAESEKDGKLTTGIESVLMTPTDYSPLR